jgi:hypothetical protein
MDDDDKRETAIGRNVFEKDLERCQAAGGGSDTHDRRLRF